MVHCVSLAVKYKRSPFDDGLFSDFEIALPDHECSFKSLSFTRNNNQISKGTDLTRCCRAVNNPSSKENSQAKDQIFWVTMRETQLISGFVSEFLDSLLTVQLNLTCVELFGQLNRQWLYQILYEPQKLAEKLYILSSLLQIPPSNVQTKFLTLYLVHKLLKPEKKQTNMNYRYPFLQNIKAHVVLSEN